MRYLDRLKVGPEEEQRIVASVESAAGLSGSYLTLLVLSTVIATFGLIANSAATVIGAMIVAPLMGPILGIGLGYAQGDTVKFRRAMTAEAAGVVLCLLISMMIAFAVGPDRIDFSQGEIEGRVHPTLFDLAVGLAAGLAGAYATVNQRVSGSIAGVAIAVALVPPLCVSGLCAAASLQGFHYWSSALGAFLLFLANFLTIQGAAISVFLVSGLGHWQNFWADRQLRRAMLLDLVLLAGTGWFLWRQLDRLVQERSIDQTTRQILVSRLGRIPGAHLDSLRVRVESGRLVVDALTRAPRDLPSSFAAQVEHDLLRKINLPLELRVGTVLSSYVTPRGELYRPETQKTPDPLVVRLEKIQHSLESAIKQFPGVELDYFRETPDSDGADMRLFVALTSPYLFDANLVAKFQSIAEREANARLGDKNQLHLTVRTALSQVFTDGGQVVNALERALTPEEVRQAKVEAITARAVDQLLREQPGVWQDSLQIKPILEPQESEAHSYQIILTVHSPKPIPKKSVEKLTNFIQQGFQEGAIEVVFRNGSGREFKLSVSRQPSSVPTSTPSSSPTPPEKSQGLNSGRFRVL